MDQEPHYLNRVLLVALVLGICADLLFYGQQLGISAPIFVSAWLVALIGLSVSQGRRPTRANLWLGAAALFFAACLALRDAPLLVALDTIAVLGALLLLVTHYRGPALVRLPIGRVLQHTLHAIGAIGVRPAGLVNQSIQSMPIEPAQMRRLLPLVRGLMLALPVLIVFGALLMAADDVFASYVIDMMSFRFPFDPATAMSNIAVTLIVAYLSAGGLQIALAGYAPKIGHQEGTYDLPADGITKRLDQPQASFWRLGCTEALTVLLAVDLLFSGFMLVQAAYFFGGMDTLNRTGMTYAVYARRGFFELLAVTGLSLGLLWMLTVLTQRPQRWQRRVFNGASAALIGLMLGLLASAFQRMLLYEQAYGYTHLRLYTHSFMIWLAVVLPIFLVALLRNRLRIFTVGCIATGLIYLALLNVINPDALIVRENIARYQTSGKLDTEYLASLSADAIPALTDSLGKLDSGVRTELDPQLKEKLDVLQQAAAEYSWPSWHVARSQALSHLRGVYGGSGGG